MTPQKRIKETQTEHPQAGKQAEADHEMVARHG